MRMNFKVWTTTVSLLAIGQLATPAGAFAEALATEPSSQTLEIGATQPGNYLSALIASADRDTVAAEVYYREALRADPRNTDLLERALDESERMPSPARFGRTF